jgi:hypothetical protein
MRNCSARVSPLSGLKRKSDFGAVRSVDDPGRVTQSGPKPVISRLTFRDAQVGSRSNAMVGLR